MFRVRIPTTTRQSGSELWLVASFYHKIETNCKVVNCQLFKMQSEAPFRNIPLDGKQTWHKRFSKINSRRTRYFQIE